MLATRVNDIYTRDPETITPGTQLSDIATMMIEKGAHFLPVMEDGRVIGIISRREILQAIVRQENG